MSEFFVRDLDPEMGTAVAKRTYLRKGELWSDLAKRVAFGNASLHETGEQDRLLIERVICNGDMLTAGRHLQHGDANQSNKNLELFSNCSTACTSFLEFLLLLNGSGVGRNYSDELMVINWQNMPHLYCVLSAKHADFQKQFSKDYTPKLTVMAQEDMDAYPRNPNLYHIVEDSREGWAKALEILEVAAFEKKPHEHYVFDFSNIRKYGTPIKGMQNRPASGPLPLIYALQEIAKVKYMCLPKWKQTMFVDHFCAEVVANGGSRRSSRICIKYWQDEDIEHFINIKKENPWLWSSNNSVAVDNLFWNEAVTPGTKGYDLFLLITSSSFNTAEPGMINIDQLTGNR